MAGHLLSSDIDQCHPFTCQTRPYVHKLRMWVVLAGMRAPFMVTDHNGQQHQTEVMKGNPQQPLSSCCLHGSLAAALSSTLVLIDMSFQQQFEALHSFMHGTAVAVAGRWSHAVCVSCVVQLVP